MTLEESIKHHFPGWPEENRQQWLGFCDEWILSGFADSNAKTCLCSPEETKFWSQLSEAFVENSLRLAKLNLVARSKRCSAGPDFLIEHEGRRIWVEVVTPEPTNVPGVHDESDGTWRSSYPASEIRLRWTAAIKEKIEKLLGRPATDGRTPTPGYLESNIVKPDDIYVIAVNDVRFGNLSGLSVLDPSTAVEVVLGVGVPCIRFDQTSNAIQKVYEYCPVITNLNGASIPTNLFWDEAYAPVSAIWGGTFFGINEGGENTVVVHNPHARNPLPEKLLPARAEYVAVKTAQGKLTVERRKGLLAP